jgi:hypothetical protein
MNIDSLIKFNLPEVQSATPNEYAKSCFYLGQCNILKNSFEGKGVLVYGNGDLYEGNFLNSVP